MPPCFDCGKKLKKGNIWTVTNDIMKTKPDYDYRLSEKDPKFFLTNPQIKEGMITLCNNCDIIRCEKKELKINV